MDRARLMTESYRQTEEEPALVRRAEAFFVILNGLPIAIGDDELLVGNVSSQPRLAYFAPETFNWSMYRPGNAQRRADRRLATELTLDYRIPPAVAAYWRDKPTGDMAGHFVADYEIVIRRGVEALREEIARHEPTPFYRAADRACQAAIRFAERHAQEALERAEWTQNPTRKAELRELAAICSRVPARPATTFHEALQAFWFTHVMIHINSKEWSISPGRFDQYMLPFYRRDISEGRLTRERAAELLACLWIKFSELRIDADLLNYQNLMLGGQDPDGNDATNELTWLCLEVTEALKLFQPSVSLRWHPGTPEVLLDKACGMIASGLGMPALFNDLQAIPALEHAGVAPEHAWNYSIAGCEELAVAGKLFGVMRCGAVNQATCVLDAVLDERRELDTFGDVMTAYRDCLRAATSTSMDRADRRDRRNAAHTPHPFVSLLFPGCIASGRDITEGGAEYNITSSTEAGSITAANALLAIRKAVFEDRAVTLRELRDALRADFRACEPLRQYLLNHVPKFGNDHPEADTLARRVVDLNEEVIRELGRHDRRGGIFATGSGGATSYQAGTEMGATPNGRHAGKTLSVSLGPEPGTDTAGPTAMLNSVAKLNWRTQVGGALTHLKFSPETVANDDGRRKLESLLTAHFKQGGLGVHVSVVDAATLRDALERPDEHRSLLVRVGGFSAPFVLLSPELQQNIIERTEYNLA